MAKLERNDLEKKMLEIILALKKDKNNASLVVRDSLRPQENNGVSVMETTIRVRKGIISLAVCWKAAAAFYRVKSACRRMRLHALADKQIISIRNEARYRDDLLGTPTRIPNGRVEPKQSCNDDVYRRLTDVCSFVARARTTLSHFTSLFLSLSLHQRDECIREKERSETTLNNI